LWRLFAAASRRILNATIERRDPSEDKKQQRV
jgi:hypothetical protein